MDELSAILSAWKRRRSEPGDAVMATVVHVEGSAYRRPGARMLICGDGNCIGSISGGCLEGDVTRKAAWWTEDGEAVLRVYDTSSEEASWEFGLGCNGVITLMLERIANPAADEALAFLESHRSCVVAIAIRAADDDGQAARGVRPGDRLLWNRDGIQGGALAGSRFRRRLAAEAALAFEERRSRMVHLPDVDVFVEYAAAPQRVVIFGAGHDAVPLASLAVQAGWSVTVADGRPGYAKPARFPGAERVVVLPVDANISEIGIDRDTAVVMMTHNLEQDRRLLRQVLPKRPKYLGLLGPKQRAEMLFREIGESMGEWDVHAPAGFDLGGETPAGVALSIVSEIMAVREGRSGGSLKWRRGPIHSAARESGEASPYSREELVELTLCGTHG